MASSLTAASVLLSTPAGVRLVTMRAGYHHSCGVAFGGVAYCWGLNIDGARGDGTTVTPSTPVSVAAPEGVTFASVSPGVARTCGVTATGVAYCWGSNSYGSVSDGTGLQRTNPVAVA